MTKGERVWTQKEEKWIERLKSDPDIELISMSELLPTIPSRDAHDLLLKKYGREAALSWCRLMMIHTTVEMTRDVVVLLHGAMNCVTCIRNFHSSLITQWGHGFIHTPSTAIDNRQVIFGGEENLYEALKDVDRDYRPKLIIVMTGCAPALTQDDVEQVVHRVEPEIEAKVIYQPTAGFEIVDQGIQLEEASLMWVNVMDPPKNVQKNTVNILGSAKEVYYKHARGVCGERQRPYPSDADELGRMVEAIGLKVHRVLFGGDYDYVRTAPEAEVNTVLCGTWGFPMAEEMKKRFGTPFVYQEQPLGLDSCRRWLMELAELTNRQEEAEKFIKQEEEAIKGVWEQCKEAVAGKVAIVGGRGNRAALYLRLLKELGMEVIYGAAEQLGAIQGTQHCQRVTESRINHRRVDWEYYLDYGFDPLFVRVKDGSNGSEDRLLKHSVIIDRLGIPEEDLLYLYCDFSTSPIEGDASRIAHLNASAHLRRRPGYPSRAVGYKGTEGFCLDIIEAFNIAKRKNNPPYWTRIYSS